MSLFPVPDQSATPTDTTELELSTTLILGLGNVLLTDEGAGAAVLRALEPLAESDPRLSLQDGGTLSFTLAGPIAEASRLVVVDAANLGQPPGSVRVLQDADMDAQLAQHATSVHEVSLSDLFDIARLTESLPARRALVGIQPERIEWGSELSAPVAAAVPRAVAEIEALLRRWDLET
jgi:hydrogenase maturation protease